MLHTMPWAKILKVTTFGAIKEEPFLLVSDLGYFLGPFTWSSDFRAINTALMT